MRIGELVQLGMTELQAAGVPDCTSDVYLLLGQVLGKSRTGLLARASDTVGQEQIDQFLELLSRRKLREPAAYILGEQEFWSLPFHVSPSVLIPRPETEFLLETVFADLKRTPLPGKGVVVDLCCGSGVIAIVLALELGCSVLATDFSIEALAVTQNNIGEHKVEDLVKPVRGDLLEHLPGNRTVSLVVSNPPYVSSHAIAHELEPEVCDYEPLLALDGGERGLDLIERIRGQLPDLLMAGGRLFMEIGADQGLAVREIFSAPEDGKQHFSKVEIIKDYSGRDRVLHCVRS